MVINDFLRGKLPWYMPDPNWPERKGKEDDEEFVGREGKLGEKRKKAEQDVDESDVSEMGSRDGLEDDAEADNGEEEEDEGESSGHSEEDVIAEESEDERIKDNRPPKKIRRD